MAGDQRRHPQRGVSEGDYYGLRPWQSGDSMRWIHWRTTAKMGRPTVLQFERQRNRDVALLLDPWLPAEPREQRRRPPGAGDQPRGHGRRRSHQPRAPRGWSSRSPAASRNAGPGRRRRCFATSCCGELATLPAADGSSLRRDRDADPRPGAQRRPADRHQPAPAAGRGRPERDNLCWIDVSAAGTWQSCLRWSDAGNAG